MALFLIVAGAIVSFLAGCTPKSASPSATPEGQKELDRLRVENKEVKRLRAENQDLVRLRKENLEIQRLREFAPEISRLRVENEQMRQNLATAGIKIQPPAPEPQPPNRPPPIENLVQAFADAALVVTAQGPSKPEDTPQEGDNILIDQSVIGLIIPDFQDRTNSGPYEVSGWLAAKGVVLTNYQQFNFLGITNYQIRRAPPKNPNAPAK